jgi:hypothetical protein
VIVLPNLPAEIQKEVGDLSSQCFAEGCVKDAHATNALAKAHGVQPEATPAATVAAVTTKLVTSGTCTREDQTCVWKTAIAKTADPIFEEVLQLYFKPPGPQAEEWLSNMEIDKILSTLQALHPEFHHVPYQMDDTLKDVEPMILGEGESMGVVVNTDRSSGRGIHWYAFFACRRNSEFELSYFNSAGTQLQDAPSKWFHDYYASVLSRKAELGLRKVCMRKSSDVTTKSLQDNSHSCGVWSIFYIWMRILGVPHSWFIPSNVTDETMQFMRKRFFAPA